MSKYFITLISSILLFGCAASPTKYIVEPTPLKKGVSKYDVKK